MDVHPLIRSILTDISFQVGMIGHATDTVVAVTPLGGEEMIRWVEIWPEVATAEFCSRLANNSVLTVNVSVSSYYLDPEFNRLRQEIIRTCEAMPGVLPELRALARDILADREADIQVSVQAYMFLEDRYGDTEEEYGERFVEVETAEQWDDMLVNFIWPCIRHDGERPALMAAEMSEEDTDGMSD